MSRPVPIMFIHGYNGVRDSWELSGFRAFLIARGADPDLLRLFHYGWLDATRQRYNSRGDIRAIAARLAHRDTDDPDALHSQLRRLSEDSQRAGGPERVTIVAHSMGGLVARYYLSCQTPDEWGTVNEGVVEQLITIGTPHLGVDLARISYLVPPDAFVWRVLEWLERLPFVKGHPAEELALLDAQVRRMQYNVRAEEIPVMTEGLVDSPALAQMVPDGPFLQALSRPGAFPADVRAALIWGDVQFSGAVRWGPLPLWERQLSLGDLLIPAASASTLPQVTTRRFPQRWGKQYVVQIGNPTATPYDLSDYLPPVAHTPLLHNPQVHATVAELVAL